jgi:hypothetical protein
VCRKNGQGTTHHTPFANLNFFGGAAGLQLLKGGNVWPHTTWGFDMCQTPPALVLGVSATQHTRQGMHLGTQRVCVGHARNCFFCCLAVVFVTTVEVLQEGVFCSPWLVCYRARAVCGVPSASPRFDITCKHHWHPSLQRGRRCSLPEFGPLGVLDARVQEREHGGRDTEILTRSQSLKVVARSRRS